MTNAWRHGVCFVVALGFAGCDARPTTTQSTTTTTGAETSESTHRTDASDGATTASTSTSAEPNGDEAAGTVPRRCDARFDDACVGAACGTATLRTRPLETLRGRISYYADALHGRRTASGEPYDRTALTAASRTLPFGALVRVRRDDAPERVVVVRINDRGPSARGGRILDLSRAAAECLDMIRRGVVDVRAEVLDYGPRGRPSR